MQFCPITGTYLMIHEDSDTGEFRFECPVCQYVHPLSHPTVRDIPVDPKTVDAVLGGEDAWRHVQKITQDCPQCHHDKAFFKEIQIRSADEPASLFFRCVECGHNWREG